MADPKDKGKKPPKGREIPNSAGNLIRSFKKADRKYEQLSEASGHSCLAGSLNCFSGADGNDLFGFVLKDLPGLPSLRSYLKDPGVDKYKSKDAFNSETGKWESNNSIDAWEIHDYLRGEGVGVDPYEGVEFTYNKTGSKSQRVPDQVLENPSSLPIGTIIGQGDVNTKAGYRGFNEANDTSGKNRHSVVVIGYDETDGMPILYDQGAEVRLDDSKYTGSDASPRRFTNFTTPKDYKDLTYENILNNDTAFKEDLGFDSKDPDKNKISFESSKAPIKAIEKGVNEHQEGIAKHYDINKSTLDKFSKLLPGLSFKETKLNNNQGQSADLGVIPTALSDSLLGNAVLKPGAKALMNLYDNVLGSQGAGKPGKQDWELEIEAYNKYGKDVEKRNAYYNKLREETPTPTGERALSSSVGAFKIKDLSRYMSKIGKSKSDLYGASVSNAEELESGSVAALSLLAEKYNQAKELHKDLDLSEDQLVKLAMIGYSNASKLKSPEFVKHFIKNDTGLEDETFNKISNYDVSEFKHGGGVDTNPMSIPNTSQHEKLMNPEILAILQQMMEGQPGLAGENTGQAFGEIQKFMGQDENSKGSRLDVDPLRDIAPFRVNPFRGFLAEEGGPISAENAASMLPANFVFPTSDSMPASSIMGSVRNQLQTIGFQNMQNGGTIQGLQLDTINNVPSNVPPGIGGKFDISQLLSQQGSAPPIMNKLMNIDPRFQPDAFEAGGQVGSYDTLSLLDAMPEGGEVIGTYEDGGQVVMYKYYEDDGDDDFDDGGIAYDNYYKSQEQSVEHFGKGGKAKRQAKRAQRKADRAEWKNMTKSEKRAWRKEHGARTGFGKFLRGAGNVLGKGLKAIAPLVGLIPGVGIPLAAGIGGIGGGLDSISKTSREASLGTNPKFLQSTLSGAAGGALGALGAGPAAEGAATGFGALKGLAGGAKGLAGLGNIAKGLGGSQKLLGAFTGLGGGSGGGAGMAGFPGFNGGITGRGLGNFQGGPDLSGGIYGGVDPLSGGLPSNPALGGGSLFDLINQPRRFEHGGSTEEEGNVLVPIQTEKVGKQPEMIIHLDGSITKVNATKRHSQMDEDEVTDIVPDGSYIASADRDMRVKLKDAEDIVIGLKQMPYSEHKKGKIPEEITLGSLWGSKKKDMTPAELASRLRSKIEIQDNSDFLGHDNNIFTKLTNAENMKTRLPYIQGIVRLNEEKRLDSEPSGTIVQFGHGGPLNIKGIQHAPEGDFVEKVLPFIGSALPFLGSLFGGGKNKQNQANGGINPLVQSGILGSIPLAQLGINRNINAQQAALDQGVSDFSALGNQLIDNANQSATGQGQANLASTGLGLANALGMQTELPRLDLGASRSRLENFRPRAQSRADIDAASTPNFNAQAIMNNLGRRSGPVLAQLYSDQQRNQNAAAANRNQQLDQFDLNRIQGLNQIDSVLGQSNLAQEMGEIGRTDQQRGLALGSASQGIQRGADIESGRLGQIGNIQSQILPITTQFNQQRAGLEGQQSILGAQNALNAFSVLGGLQSQNATAGQQGQQGQQGQTGIGKFLSGLFGNNTPIGTGTTAPIPSNGTNDGAEGQSSEFGCQEGLCPQANGICSSGPALC
jgi:hypothetical protein